MDLITLLPYLRAMMALTANISEKMEMRQPPDATTVSCLSRVQGEVLDLVDAPSTRKEVR